MPNPNLDLDLKLVRDAVVENRLSVAAGDEILRCLTCADYADWHPEIVQKLHERKFADLEDAFYRRIPFGTAGQRGPLGAGPNRINERTIAESVQGVCDYVAWLVEHAEGLAKDPRAEDARLLRQRQEAGELLAVVAYDTRMDSAWFAQVVVEVLTGNGWPVRFFGKPAPTPELSHAVLELSAALGFMVSASHNPPTDNGAKVYWHYGGQVLPENAAGITEATERVAQVRRKPLDEACRDGQVVPIGPEMDDGYRRCVLAQGMTTTGGPLPERSARIVFSPLHGVGEDAVVPVLEAAGWKLGESLFLVESQRRPDPRFRGAPGGIPNPEVPTSLEAGVALARRPDVRGDLVLATDPDADRLAIQVVSSERPGVPSFLMGGQLCAVLGAWVLSQLRAQGRLPADGVAVRNVVTSDLVQEIAESYGLAVEWNVPVGFKYVGKVSYDLRHTPERFVFGAEQSYGFLRGMHCRDKDGAVAALLAAELCDYLKRQEPTRTVLDWLADLWRDHAYYAERANPIRMEGITGLQRIREALRGLRLRFPTEIAGVRVVEVWDMLKDRIFDPASRNEESGDDWDDLQDPLEALYGDVRELGWGWLGENVLIARLATGERDWAAVRPSGTEPSLKIYVNVRRQGGDLLAVAREAEALADEIESALKERMGLT